MALISLNTAYTAEIHWYAVITIIYTFLKLNCVCAWQYIILHYLTDRSYRNLITVLYILLITMTWPSEFIYLILLRNILTVTNLEQILGARNCSTMARIYWLDVILLRSFTYPI